MLSLSKKILLSAAAAGTMVVAIVSCKHKPQLPTTTDTGYPQEVADIFVSKCISCHNSTDNLGGLNMETWDQLFWGGGHGASVVPFDPEFSPLLYYINTDSTRGTVATPTMPFDPNIQNPPKPLSAEEYYTIRNWIAGGAPDKNGNIPFGSNASTRQKFYMTQQGCDLLSVIDAERRVMMRNIHIGREPGPESPHNVKVSHDGKYAYVVFYSGLIQKIDATTDRIIGGVMLNDNPTQQGQWNVVHLSENDSLMMASDLPLGRMKLIRTADMAVVQTYNNLPGAHGITSNAAFDTFYVGGQYGTTVYRVTRRGATDQFSLNGLQASTQGGTLDPHELLMAPDYSKYFLTCESSNEVRIMSTRTNKVIDSIKVPTKPQEMAISRVKPYLFVSCMEHETGPKERGVIVVINYNTHEVVTTLSGGFYQPHGLAVDDERQLLMVVSRNASFNGPAPHHTTSCGGNSGWYNLFDMANGFAKVPASGRKYEVMSDPYSVDARFKK